MRLSPLTKKLEARLFHDRQAPLSSLANKIDMALALRLITDDDARELSLIRTIRNAFAHAVGIDFAEEAVATQCRKFTRNHPRIPIDRMKTSAREKFIYSALTMDWTLSTYAMAYIEKHSPQSGAPQKGK
jgi:hypothetical protein